MSGIHLSHGFVAVPHPSVGVFTVHDAQNNTVKTFSIETDGDAMDQWVEGYVQGLRTGVGLDTLHVRGQVRDALAAVPEEVR